MRISFILSSLWLSGGVRVVVEYANHLSERGYEITLIFPKGTGDADVEKEILSSVKTIEAGQKSYSQTTPLSMLGITHSLARAVPASDVIFSTQTPTTPAGWLARQRFKGSKLVWLYQDYREMFIGRPIEDWLIRHGLRWHDCAFAVSEPAREELLSYSSGKVEVVGEGLTGMEFFSPLPPESRLHDPQGRKIILYVGDTRPRKGWDDFWAAATHIHGQVPETVVWIVSKETLNFASELPHEYIFRPSRESLAKLYASCDVFVSASWWESFGLPPLEAMACGAPVVLTDSRGIREYAVHEKNCLMVPTRAPGHLASAVSEVLTNNALADRLRQNGPPTAAHFTWDSAVHRFEKALRKIIQEH